MNHENLDTIYRRYIKLLLHLKVYLGKSISWTVSVLKVQLIVVVSYPICLASRWRYG